MIYSLTVQKVPLDISKITDNSLEIAVYNEEGLKLDEFNAFSTQRATLDKIPTHVVNAFLSIEDKKFFSHKGVNVPRMFKAFLNNIKSMSLKEGASTITQQLIKNTHLSFEKNLPRKLNEIVLSINLERQMSKNDILENYLNVIYFGSGAYGLENASQHYFSKPVQKLSVEEGALLAGIIKSPNKYSPISHPEKAKERRN
ncbi:MAG: transglycosylase domain-containing protein, partial [Clostridia bacterium]|nr:transglycosylase domain-containing protein [Clostridia bacterium]